jgi:hypothetical protein
MASEALIHSIDRVFEQVFASPAVECFARAGCFLLRLAFASKALADEFLPSFLPAENGPPELQIGFLTSAEADLSHLIPEPPTEHRLLASQSTFALWQPGDLPILHLLDRESKRAVIWLPADAAPDWFANLPALPVMYAFAADTPWIALHSAAVGRDDRILLLAGAGRVGKTTAAVACARAGWDYAGDDYVYVNTSNGRVEPLYCSARLRADTAPAFPELLKKARATCSDGELRYELRLATQLDRGRVRGGSVAAILLPRRSGAAFPKFSPARRFDVVSALYTSMLLIEFGWREAMIKKITSTVGLAPVFFVDTGQHPDAIPDAFAAFLDRL